MLWKTFFLNALVVTVPHSSEPVRLQDLSLGRELSSVSDCYEVGDSEFFSSVYFFPGANILAISPSGNFQLKEDFSRVGKQLDAFCDLPENTFVV